MFHKKKNYKGILKIDYGNLAYPVSVHIHDIIVDRIINEYEKKLDKRTDYVNNILKDTVWANNVSEKLPLNVKTAILNYIYEMLVMNAVDAYYLNKMSFCEIKEMFRQNIDTDIFKENDIFNAQFAVKLCKRVLDNNHFKFFMSYNTRRYIKEHFPEFTKTYFRLKRRILGC